MGFQFLAAVAPRRRTQIRRLRIESLEDRIAPATLTLTIAADQIAENAGPAATTGTLTRSGMDESQPLTVTLTSSDTSEATVPSQVVFGPGQTSIPFDINAVDDGDIDGDQTVTITGTATIGGSLALDSGFGGGRKTQGFLSNAVAVYPDGDVVVAGPLFLGTSTPNYYDFAVSRYNPDATVEWSVTTDISGEGDKPEVVVIQPDGKIVVAGIAWNGPFFDWVLARYNSNGTLDTSFGNGGKVLIDMGPGSYNEIWDLALQADGKILAAGNIEDPSPTWGNFALVRYNTNGTIDTSFGVNGVAKTSFGTGDRCFGVAVQPDGNIVMAGVNDDGNSISKFSLARFTPAGILDFSFGTGGKVQTDITGEFDEATDVLILPDGKLLVAGHVGPTGTFPPQYDFVVARYNANGTLDTTFGNNGYTIKNFGGEDQAAAVGVQTDGRILVAGVSIAPGNVRTGILARFSAQGVFESSISSPSSSPQNMAIAASGRAYVVGFVGSAFSGYTEAYATGQVLTDSDTVVVIDNDSSMPVAENDSYSVDEDNPLSVDAPGLLSNDSDPDSDALTARKVTDPSHGTVTVNPDGSFVYTPNANYFGSDSFTYVANDGGLDSSRATVTITINPINDAPTLAAIGDLTILEDAAEQTVNLSGIAAGPNETQALTVTAVSDNPGLISNPSVTYTSPNATGTLKFTPVANQFGTATITVTVTDDGGTANGGVNTFSRTLSVTVTPVNDAPTLNAISDPPPIEDADPHTIDLTGISAGPNESQILTITAVSDNPGLVPNPTVDYTSPSGTGTLTFGFVPNQAGVATITVTVTDDGGTANGGIDSFSRTFTVGSVNDAPTLDAISDPDPVPEDADWQTINLTGITAGGGENQILTVTATSSNTSLIPNPNIEYTSSNTTGTLRFKPLANLSGSAVITVKVRDNGGTALGGVDEFTRTFTVNISPQPDGPVMETWPIRMITAVPKKPAPINPPGSPVADLVADVTDLDDDPRGMSIVGFDPNVKGIWQFSLDGGATWQNVPSNVSETTAILLTDDPSTRVRFLPGKKFKGFASFRYMAWDRSDGGTEGTQVDTTLVPTAYSDRTERAWVAVGKTKPIVNSRGATLLTPVKEDRKFSKTFAVKKFIGIAGLEQLPATNLGIAITDLNEANGKWQYRLAKTKTFVDIGPVSLSSALLLRPTDVVRFIPNPNASGQAELTFKTWDQSGQAGAKVDTAAPGFGTDFGFAELTIIEINDQPKMDLSVAAVLNPVNPSETTNVRTFASMMSATDVESSSFGVAITAMTGGWWQYRTPGGTFTQIMSIPAGKALLLDAETEIRLVAPSDAPVGTATLSFKAWDKSPGSGVAGSFVKPRGTAFSKETEILTVAVGNVAPVLDTIPIVMLPPVFSTNPSLIPGTTVKTLLGTAMSDVPGTLQGIAIIFADNANGKWQYSLDGKIYIDIGTVSAGSALLLTDLNKIRFVPDDLTQTTATIQYVAWDRMTGQAGDRIDTTPLNSFSLEIETATANVG